MQPVPDTGSHNAKLLVVAEHGGKEEGRLGLPMQGTTGRKVKRLIEKAGLDPENDVRYANVIPWAMGGLPKTFGGMRAVVDAHWEDLTPTLRLGNHNAILVLGRAALYRVLGRSGVLSEQGSVYNCGVLGDGTRHVPVVVSTHPASVMRSKLEAGWSLVDVAVTRACEYAGGMGFDVSAQTPTYTLYNDGGTLNAALSSLLVVGASTNQVLTCDTEFSTITNKPFLVGLTFDGEHVLSVRVNASTLPVLRVLFAHKDLVKRFHHAPADLTALLAVDVDVRPPIEDTLRFNSILYPDLPVGLSKVTLFRLNHWHNWKGMAHDDPEYNAIDVVATHRVGDVQHAELEQGGLWPVWEREAKHMGLLCMAMEARGLAVDTVARDTTIAAWQAEVDTKTTRLKEIADACFSNRITPLLERVDSIGSRLLQLGGLDGGIRCEAHPKYIGARKPSKKAQDCPTCATIYESLAGRRTEVKELRSERTKLANKIKKWTVLPSKKTKIIGFDPGNNDHARWILYDKSGFGFPTQRKDGAVTANAGAMARLRTLKKVQENPLGVEFLDLRQERQHLAKMISTFLNPKLDNQGCAHPEYRDYGTGTGRLAGGADGDLGDKKTNPYAYNAMNIPNKTRHIYVPHSETFVVTPIPKDKHELDSGDEDDDNPTEGED